MPVLMLTAKDEVVDRVLGLEMGADDYITKPFSLRELEARIKSVLRRARAGAVSDGQDEAPILRCNLRIDPVRREVMIGDRQVELTPKEFDLLRLFAANPGRVFPRKYLLEKSGITLTKATIAPLILTSTACEKKSKRTLIILS